MQKTITFDGPLGRIIVKVEFEKVRLGPTPRRNAAREISNELKRIILENFN